MKRISVHPHCSGGNNEEIQMPNSDEERVIVNSFRGCMPCTTLERLSSKLLVNKETVYRWCDNYRTELLSMLDIQEDPRDKPNLFRSSEKMSEVMLFKPTCHVRDQGFAPLTTRRLLPLLSEASVTYIIKELQNIRENKRKRRCIRTDFNQVIGETSKKMKKVHLVSGGQERSFVEKRVLDAKRGKELQHQFQAEEVEKQIHDLEESETLEDLEESQRLRDKISTLHDLINPFGLTNEASVLEDAYDYIRFLHNQIEMMYTWLYYHKNDVQDATGEMRNGLTERGLRLAPVSFTRNIIQDKP